MRCVFGGGYCTQIEPVTKRLHDQFIKNTAESQLWKNLWILKNHIVRRLNHEPYGLAKGVDKLSVPF